MTTRCKMRPRSAWRKLWVLIENEWEAARYSEEGLEDKIKKVLR
jgi:hypothetical protein